MVIEDKAGHLLGARIAKDGQWRFPYQQKIPEKFEEALLEFEDRRFYYHPGIDPFGIGRAIQQNVKNGKIVSGGSTLTMQVMRMARGKKSRSVFNKLLEAIMATRLEIGHSKKEILAFYASNAPFGGNVVGLDAASWRYFGKQPALLSWGEAAMLAVLPNSPSLVHPGRNRAKLLAKRNRLLDRLQEAGKIDKLTCELAKEEPLPKKPLPLPRLAPHLLDRAYAEQFAGKKGEVTRLKTTIDKFKQIQVADVVHQHNKNLKDNGIHNLAAIIIEVETGDVLAYVGNVLKQGSTEHGHEVDIIRAPRSTGSIIKPLLYALMNQEGELLPQNLVSDIPTNMGSFQPENFSSTYDGAVSAQKSLSRSLNVPTVKLLGQYGLEKFHYEIKKAGLTTINKSPDHYGLPLILGGAEVNLLDVTNVYACMARSLGHFYEFNSRYDPHDFRAPNYVFGNKAPKTPERKLLKEAPRISAAATWLTFAAMQEVERPNSEGSWEFFDSSHQIAWKTGTSFGFRDAWAIGVTPKYAVGVWVGNADGEGRPGLVGVKAAAPVLFELFDLLPESEWFEQPYDEMVRIPVCKKSGFRAKDLCAEQDSVWITTSGLKTKSCPYHKMVHLDQSTKFQVHSDCESPANMIHQPWFVLPPVEEHYYKKRHPNYDILPPFREDCLLTIATTENQPMQLIYPKEVSKIYIPKDLDGKKSRTVFKVAHRQPTKVVHWHVDNQYAGSTTNFHQMELNPEPGKHLLTLVDQEGHRLEQSFEILTK